MADRYFQHSGDRSQEIAQVRLAQVVSRIDAQARCLRCARSRSGGGQGSCRRRQEEVSGQKENLVE